MIGIINYGMGNLQSVKNSLDYLNIPNVLVNTPKEIDLCDKIILPGVGAFGPAMEKLHALGLVEKIIAFAHQQKPILGLCLGMQLLFEEGREYGSHQGFGLIKGTVLPFSEQVKKLPIPLVGWNNIKKETESPLLKNIAAGSCFYFVHSFYCQPTDMSTIIASADYGISFAAVINMGTIYGCQFHPEKSQAAGLQLLKNFHDQI